VCLALLPALWHWSPALPSIRQHVAVPRWASTNLGVFVCIRCSGLHRKLGTHLSVVRSTTLDTWTADQMERFRAMGGNANAAARYEARPPPNFRRPDSTDAYGMEQFIRDKYERKLYMEGGAGGGARRGGDGPRVGRGERRDDYRGGGYDGGRDP